MDEEITRESIPRLNLEELALNKDFGRLTFNASLPDLQKTQGLFKELDDLAYHEVLTPEEAAGIDTTKDQFVEQVKKLQSFDIGQADPQSVHDNLEQEFINFHNRVSREMRTSIVFLRQEAASKSQNAQELQAQQKAALQASSEYKVLSEQLKKDLGALQKQRGQIDEEKKKVEEAHGELGSKVLAYHFAKQATDYAAKAGDNFYAKKNNNKAKKKIKERFLYFFTKERTLKKYRSWRTLRLYFMICLFIVILFNFGLYFLIFFLNKFNIIQVGPSGIFTPEYLLIKVALIALLYYGMHFASRNYNIACHNETINRHRKNVAQTLEDFLAAPGNDAVKGEILRQGIEAMFKHIPTGHIKESGSDDDDFKGFLSVIKEIKK